MSRIGDWFKTKFSGAAKNGGGSTGPDDAAKAEIAAIQGKDGLNTFLGDILQREGAVSNTIQETLGRVQGATVAIALAYDTADAATKADLETKGIIVDHPFIPNKKTVSTTVLEAAKAQVTDFEISDEKVSEWADKLEHIATTVAQATPEQIAKGLEINQQHDGVNPDRDATKAVMIAPIYGVMDENLENYGKAIAAVHTATRSGFGDKKFGTNDRTERFNADLADNDPVWLRRMIKSAKKIHTDPDNATPEDMKNVQDGLAQAVNLAKTSEAALEGAVDLTKITPSIERYAAITQGKPYKPTVTAEATTGPKPKAGFIIEDGEEDEVETAENPFAAIDAELEAAKKAADKAVEGAAEKVKREFNGPESDKAAALEEKSKYIKAIGEAVGADNLHKDSWTSFTKSDFLPYLVEKTDITSTKDGEAVLTAKDGSYSFTVTQNGITHDDTNNDVSAEEALISANLIKLNAKAHSKGVTIGGTDDQKAMYLIGLKEAGVALKINNEDEIKAIPDEIMARAQARFDSFLDERRTADGKPDYKSFTGEENDHNNGSAPKPKEPRQAPGAGGGPQARRA